MNEYHDSAPGLEIAMDLLDMWILEDPGLCIPTSQEVEEVTCGRWSFDERREFTRGVCWCLPTREWVQGLLPIFHGKKVLEIGAGTGFVGAVFRLHGVDWTSTDINPAQPVGRPWAEINPVHQMDWEEALKTPHDVIFISWWPYKEPTGTDLKIARWARIHGKRVIIVGEGNGGCTGSEDFWRYADIKELLPYDRDVAQWRGINDFTYEVTGINPKGRRLWSDPIDTDGEDE